MRQRRRNRLAHDGEDDDPMSVVSNLFVHRDRTFFARAHQSAQQLIAVKHFAGLVLFHNQNRHAFNDFICCKAFVALQALAAAADSFPFVSRA